SKWEQSVSILTNEQRGWSVAIAFEFDEHFIAFPSLDLLFQVIREMKSFHGAGVYTSLEIFGMAGVSPFLTAGEVFKNPSRTARLVDAYWSYCKTTYSDNLWKQLLRPAIHEGILAPTQAQRLKYRHWLMVYGKDKIYCTPWEGKLAEDYENVIATVASSISQPYIRNESGLYDVFEPNRIRSALEHEAFNLGHLIFSSSDWLVLNGGRIYFHEDPLTQMFKDRGLLESATYLRAADFYQSLFAAESEKVERHTFSYRSDKQYWSITPVFPQNMFVNQRSASIWNESYISALENIRTTTLADFERKRKTSRSRRTESDHPVISLEDMVLEKQTQLPRWPLSQFHALVGLSRTNILFKTIVEKNTRDVAIGPLEYCGTGRMVTDTHGKKILTICWSDVGSLSRDQLHREVSGLNRRTSGIAKQGKAKKAMTERSKAKTSEKVEKLLGQRSSSDVHESSLSEQSASKKRRMSQDQSGKCLKGGKSLN
ncbi:hypothetical protein EV361DRAFT_872191, partial [Lentinula raphanica]